MHQKLNWKDFQDKNQLESILRQDILNIAKNNIMLDKRNKSHKFNNPNNERDSKTLEKRNLEF